MRPVLSVDLICAGRAVLNAPPSHRDCVAKRLLMEAEEADSYRLRTGLAHPELGNGTLADVARRRGMAPEPLIGDPDFAQALVSVLACIANASIAKHRLSK